MQQGKAIIFSAPSGSGKTTIVKHLLAAFRSLEFSISASTRSRRSRTEQNAKDYYFLSEREFKQKIEEDAFIEWEEVYEGSFYGTLKSEVDRIWAAGNHVIFDVDVKGGLSLKQYFGESAISIFVKVPDIETLRTRLTNRSTESEESLAGRLDKAKLEMSFEDKFDVSLVNSSLKESLPKAEKLVRKFINGS